jgi:hypothetical protein
MNGSFAVARQIKGTEHAAIAASKVGEVAG